MGPPGIKGTRGLSGPKGEQGSIGSPGPVGLPGPAGVNGFRGEPGYPGSAGSPGLDGFNGAKGSAGPKGSQGPPGSNGRDGDSVSIDDLEDMINQIVKKTLNNELPKVMKKLKQEILNSIEIPVRFAIPVLDYCIINQNYIIPYIVITQTILKRNLIN